MKTSKEIPAIYKKCQEVFGVDWNKGICITYGDTAYCKYDLPPDLEVHESVHVEQQKKTGVEKWWDLYLSNKNFRLLQEIEAYKAQVRFINKHLKDREKRFAMIRRLRLDLSSSVYGDMISFDETKVIL